MRLVVGKGSGIARVDHFRPVIGFFPPISASALSPAVTTVGTCAYCDGLTLDSPFRPPNDTE